MAYDTADMPIPDNATSAWLARLDERINGLVPLLEQRQDAGDDGVRAEMAVLVAQVTSMAESVGKLAATVQRHESVLQTVKGVAIAYGLGGVGIGAAVLRALAG